ncbi:hypothetical protein B0T26DRAFT_132190 [Lasiosphaeria miniovina]|uniref:Uncharacterized protein n=1 Tax=Lasiosphaeria miniovina TaxID=1954250 RepID=A0AA40B449_9PEZI|nr:uncharacterized protein B0T26DRAFT_132190 [Lasiosphaeria miniovina]KAK0727364.1 hypothetical protein B0T26DRAFT_132190 [Lasiosphaeria miniovina]
MPMSEPPHMPLPLGMPPYPPFIPFMPFISLIICSIMACCCWVSCAFCIALGALGILGFSAVYSAGRFLASCICCSPLFGPAVLSRRPRLGELETWTWLLRPPSWCRWHLLWLPLATLVCEVTKSTKQKSINRYAPSRALSPVLLCELSPGIIPCLCIM